MNTDHKPNPATNPQRVETSTKGSRPDDYGNPVPHVDQDINWRLMECEDCGNCLSSICDGKHASDCPRLYGVHR